MKQVHFTKVEVHFLINSYSSDKLFATYLLPVILYSKVYLCKNFNRILKEFFEFYEYRTPF